MQATLCWDKAFHWINERKGRNGDTEKKMERMALADKIPVGLCGEKSSLFPWLPW